MIIVNKKKMFKLNQIIFWKEQDISRFEFDIQYQIEIHEYFHM